MVWKIDLTPQSLRDLKSIQRHLADSYIAQGQDIGPAVARAERRARFLRNQAGRLQHTPHRGTRHDDMLSGLRSATFDELAIWFIIDGPASTVRVLAFFYSGQDQHARMLARLSPPQG
jgi:plasmid stabilization system protein ParE